MMWPSLATAVLALVSFFWFPGHTILLSDTQIYIPIMERIANPALYPNDIMASRPHVRFTIYDEVALALRKVTSLGFEPLLLAQQFLYRWLGMLGIYLVAASAQLSLARALAVTAMVSLGAVVNGPQVLTVEYEPVPRGFAMSFVLLSLGCASQKWWKLSAGLAGIALCWHPPTALAYSVLLAFVLVWQRQWKAVAWLGGGVLLLALAILVSPPSVDSFPLFGKLEPATEQLQRMRSSYNWIGTWWQQWWRHYVLLSLILAVALARIWKDLPPQLKLFLAGLPLIGIMSLPVSYWLLDRMKWAIVAQYQPGRYLVFVTLIASLCAAIAGLRARRYVESAVFLFLPFALPMQPDLTAVSGVKLGLAAGLALLGAFPPLALPAAAVAFLVIPTVGKVVNFPKVHTTELNQLAQWASTSTPIESVFQFANIRRGAEAGIFRARGLRAVYADWKAGGQANFQHDFGLEWLRRWQAVERAQPLSTYRKLGVDYIVYSAGKQPPGLAPVYQNVRWVVVPTN